MSKLDKNEFICLKFDAWDDVGSWTSIERLYEKDDNLPYSLLEFIWDELEAKLNKDETITKEIKDKIKKLGKKSVNLWKNMVLGAINATNIKAGTSPITELSGIKINASFDGSKFVGYVVNASKEDENEEESYHKKVKELQNCFKELSKTLADNGKKLIIFIDELDRCEAENILNLLASIKLFFSLGGEDEDENKNDDEIKILFIL